MSVEKEIEFNLRMTSYNAPKRFEGEPTDSIELVFYQ